MIRRPPFHRNVITTSQECRWVYPSTEGGQVVCSLIRRTIGLCQLFEVALVNLHRGALLQEFDGH